MGMDVYGKNPANEAGEYFRNNVWWWHPLWSYCQQACPAARLIGGHTNDGEGLSASGAIKLADALQELVDSGHTKEFAERYEADRKALPDDDFSRHYPFSEENVKNFITFLRSCGGFEIC